MVEGGSLGFARSSVASASLRKDCLTVAVGLKELNEGSQDVDVVLLIRSVFEREAESTRSRTVTQSAWVPELSYCELRQPFIRA